MHFNAVHIAKRANLHNGKTGDKSDISKDSFFPSIVKKDIQYILETMTRN
jgi:hypothetical protein